MPEFWGRRDAGSFAEAEAKYSRIGCMSNCDDVFDAHVRSIEGHLDSSQQWQFFQQQALIYCLEQFWRRVRECRQRYLLATEQGEQQLTELQQA